jgi:AAA-like domain
MAERLTQSGKYLVLNMSFEGIGDDIFKLEATFASGFVRLLAKYAQITAPELVDWLTETAPTISSLELLDDMISVFVKKTDKKVVVLIDEVDKSSNNQLFISFLAMLRNKYLERKTFKTFHSIVLAGVHDVKNLKFKIRQGEEQKYNSPWNIASDFTVDMNLYPDEIKPMLADYGQEQGVTMDTQRIADRLFYLTSGYPFLVSLMCKTIAEEIMPTKTVMEWTETDVNTAFRLILQKRGVTNFDTVVKNLKEYPDLYNLVYSIAVDGVAMPYNSYDFTTNLGILHGIFGRTEEGMLRIHNRIYREIIVDMMTAEWRTDNVINRKININDFDAISQYHLPNKALDMQKALENFQIFMKKERSAKDSKFIERDGRLIFLAFMRPILNGAGFDFKEPQISEENRLDVIITYHQHLYVAELKIWRGEVAHEKGVAQLANYLDDLGLDTGYLLIFDHNKKKTWEKDWIDTQGKRIFWVRV